jgi:hypothetical protein
VPRGVRLRLLVVVPLLIGVVSSGCRYEPDREISDSQQSKAGLEGRQAAYVPVDKYDPARDPDMDVQQAIVEARRTGKRILLELGGDW